MTATATITTEAYKSAFVVPLTALRFTPPAPAKSAGVSVRPPDLGEEDRQQARIGAGSSQTIYVRGADGKLAMLRVRTVAISGNNAVITGKGLKPGMNIVVGLLGAGTP